MAESIERFFRLMPVGRRMRPSERAWCPAADVCEIKEGWFVVVDLAGVCPDEIEITAEGSVLHITGTRRDGLYREGISYYQLEITYSRFEKRIQFPCSIDDTQIERDYRDGLLILRLRRLGDCK
ncbi:MAG: Hsp20/alpha crystallin family protein [Pyrinomonadaceae bacterium]|nr:Hsp20/alpha crystallin family protein [Pyrinomonadaceae bacterium]